jgi:AcrR family transcriptional regulator
VTVAPARDRILDSAYELFSTRGVRAVGIDEVIERAAVAKATLYRHFPSKDELVLAFLRQREVVWTHGWVEAEARKRGAGPDEQLLAIFDLFDEWFHRADFEGCSFASTSSSRRRTSSIPWGRASAEHLEENIRTVLGLSPTRPAFGRPTSSRGRSTPQRRARSSRPARVTSMLRDARRRWRAI